jgi:Domain of unknown function (DUF4266)
MQPRELTMPNKDSRNIAPALPRAALLSGLALLGMLLGGCSPIQPWVKPYEREHLADPIMSFDRNPISDGYLDHVFEVREGARGATGSVGGGCGCN